MTNPASGLPSTLRNLSIRGRSVDGEEEAATVVDEDHLTIAHASRRIPCSMKTCSPRIRVCFGSLRNEALEKTVEGSSFVG